MSTNIYVLKLQCGKYYVGKSDDPMRRYAEHLSGSGAAWTRKYKPTGVEKIISNASAFDEDKVTKEMMARYGIDNVRGGAYVMEELDEIQEESLRREIWGAKECCTVCGRKGHFAGACRARTDIEGNELVELYKPPKKTYYQKPTYTAVKKNACFRCGRTGHYADDCYASTHVKGGYLDSDDDTDSDYDW